MNWKEKVKTQNLWGAVLFPTFKCLLIMYLLFAFVLILFGSIMIGMARSINDVRVRYDLKCESQVASPPCTFTFTPDTTLKEPNFYYELENFYANHRNFVKSRSYEQLRADTTESDDI